MMGCCKECCFCCKKKKSRRISNPEVLKIEGNPMSLKEVESHYKDLKNIYGYALEAMQNFLGKPCYPYITQPKQLYPYILYLCDGLQDHEFVAIKDMVSNKQLLNLQLTVIVKEANVIHPKITDFSRIFCKLWIDSGKECLTSVQDSSTVLLWDETFVLDVENYECDVFHFEIWSVRPSFVEKLTDFTYDNLKDDDPLAEEQGMYFLGDSMEYIKSLPCVGQNVLWTLKRGPRRFQTVGQINIFMQLITKKGEDYILHLHCHMAIMRLCYEKQLFSFKENSCIWKNWLEILPNPALTLLQQHAIQHGITPLEQCLCSWLVTSSLKMRLEDRISFYLLEDLLGHLLGNITEESIGQMYEVLCKSISDFSNFSLEMLRDLHRNFEIQNSDKADELYCMLRCMSVTKCTHFVECFEILEDEASLWYLKIIADVKADLEEDDSIYSMGEGLKNILKMYLKNQILLDDVFNRAWNVSYSSITYKKLDSVVCATLKPMVEHLMVLLNNPDRKKKISESLKMLQLYHTMRNLVNYVMTCISTKSLVLCMDDYSTWFGEEMVLEWFLLCDLYTQPFIKRAVLADSMERMGKNIVHGTSVPDVSSIIDEMVIDVWIKLKWKDQFYTHGALIEAVKTCVLNYSDIIKERLLSEKLYCPLPHFEMNTKLCVALSNVFAISEHLNKTKKRIKLELKAAEISLGFDIPNPLLAVENEMQISTSKIFLLLSSKISKRIKDLMKQAVKSKIDFLTEGSADVCLYVDNSLEILYCNLKFDAFHIILRHMWICLLKTMDNGLKHSRFQGCFMTQQKRMKIYMTLLQILNQMKNIFFCDGHGLSHYEMENKIFEELKIYLEGKLQEK